MHHLAVRVFRIPLDQAVWVLNSHFRDHHGHGDRFIRIKFRRERVMRECGRPQNNRPRVKAPTQSDLMMSP